MGKFKYRVMNSKGEKVEGIIEAESKNEVIKNVSENGYYPLSVEEILDKSSFEIKFNSKVKLKDIAIFCRQFYTMLNAGIPILECLELLSNQTEKLKLKTAINNLKDDVEKGEILSEAMKKYSDVFPNLLISLIASGEASGKMNSIMLRMSSNYEKEYKISNKIKNAMMYPCILGVVCVGVIIFILSYVMPTFLEIFEQTGATLPWTTRFVIWLSLLIKNNYLMIALILVSIITLIRIFIKSEKGIDVLSKLKLKLPVIKKMNQMIIVSRFTRNLSILINSGLKLVDSLEIVSVVCNNKLAENELKRVKEKLIKGYSLNKAIDESGMFPKMLSSMIKIGEDTGALDDILDKTADFYDEELETSIQRTVTLLEPILIVIMGVIIAFIVMAIMLPMFDTYSKI